MFVVTGFYYYYIYVLGDEGHLLWDGNWISYLDTMLQIQVLGSSGRGLRLPTRVKALRIDPMMHQERATQFQGKPGKALFIILDGFLKMNGFLRPTHNAQFSNLYKHLTNICPLHCPLEQIQLSN